MPKCEFSKIEIKCGCPKAETCPRNGKCCECVAFHRDRGDLPFCLRK